ncbi:hypothetical protein [Roseococcus sp. YIM B11640]|uniref:hypothetical protein n=1 Tax=Roseococcus sp. YIM B11640 TaxID=3133973 RepID=UPI003C7E5A04
MDPVHFGAVIVTNVAIGMAAPPIGYCLRGDGDQRPLAGADRAGDLAADRGDADRADADHVYSGVRVVVAAEVGAVNYRVWSDLLEPRPICPLLKIYLRMEDSIA